MNERGVEAMGKRGHGVVNVDGARTERQRHWLKRLQACEQAGETIRRYSER